MAVYATSNSNTNYMIGGLSSAILNTTQPSLADGTTQAAFAPGTRSQGVNGSEWVYVGPTTAAVAQYNVVWVNSSFVPANITETLAKTAGFVGFAQVAFATSECGWVMISGKPVINCPVNTNASVPLYTCNTAGFLDDATLSLSQPQVLGVTLITSNGTTTAGNAIAAFPAIRWPIS